MTGPRHISEILPAVIEQIEAAQIEASEPDENGFVEISTREAPCDD